MQFPCKVAVFFKDNRTINKVSINNVQSAIYCAEFKLNFNIQCTLHTAQYAVLIIHRQQQTILQAVDCVDQQTSLQTVDCIDNIVDQSSDCSLYRQYSRLAFRLQIVQTIQQTSIQTVDCIDNIVDQSSDCRLYRQYSRLVFRLQTVQTIQQTSLQTVYTSLYKCTMYIVQHCH